MAVDLSEYEATGLVELHPNTTWWHPGEERFNLVKDWLENVFNIEATIPNLLNVLSSNDFTFESVPMPQDSCVVLLTSDTQRLYVGQSVTYEPALCEAVAKYLFAEGD